MTKRVVKAQDYLTGNKFDVKISGFPDLFEKNCYKVKLDNEDNILLEVYETSKMNVLAALAQISVEQGHIITINVYNPDSSVLVTHQKSILGCTYSLTLERNSEQPPFWNVALVVE